MRLWLFFFVFLIKFLDILLSSICILEYPCWCSLRGSGRHRSCLLQFRRHLVSMLVGCTFQLLVPPHAQHHTPTLWHYSHTYPQLRSTTVAPLEERRPVTSLSIHGEWQFSFACVELSKHVAGSWYPHVMDEWTGRDLRHELHHLQPIHRLDYSCLRGLVFGQVWVVGCMIGFFCDSQDLETSLRDRQKELVQVFCCDSQLEFSTSFGESYVSAALHQEELPINLVYVSWFLLTKLDHLQQRPVLEENNHFLFFFIYTLWNII